MKDIDFLSNNKYVILPTKYNPKVYLAIDSLSIKRKSFELYNPFSKKAQFLKKIAYLFSYFHIFKAEKSNFISFLEEKYNKKFISSLYIATDKNKVILQLQSDGKVFGYLKIAISKLGNKKLQNELYALDTLANINKIDILDKGNFNGYNFFISKKIEGNFGYVSNVELKNILNKLERGKYYYFNEHPRVLSIYNHLLNVKNSEYIKIFNSINIPEKLQLVYEHGDFAPWNIIKNDNSYLLFDFEYFVEDGLEFFDIVKYYYQIEILIKKQRNITIFLENILEKIDFSYKKEVFILFLIKEIAEKNTENKDISFEKKILDVLRRKI